MHLNRANPDSISLPNSLEQVREYRWNKCLLCCPDPNIILIQMRPKEAIKPEKAQARGSPCWVHIRDTWELLKKIPDATCCWECKTMQPLLENNNSNILSC